MQSKIKRYQWMRNAEGGQAFGNKMEIRPLTEESFRQYVQPRLRNGFANTLAEYQGKLPNESHYALVWRAGDTDWQFAGAGSLEQLEDPVRNSPWAIEVSEFTPPQAIEFSQVADSDVRQR